VGEGASEGGGGQAASMVGFVDGGGGGEGVAFVGGGEVGRVGLGGEVLWEKFGVWAITDSKQQAASWSKSGFSCQSINPMRTLLSRNTWCVGWRMKC